MAARGSPDRPSMCFAEPKCFFSCLRGGSSPCAPSPSPRVATKKNGHLLADAARRADDAICYARLDDCVPVYLNATSEQRRPGTARATSRSIFAASRNEAASRRMSAFTLWRTPYKDVCSICLATMSTKTYRLRRCDHLFHKECIQRHVALCHTAHRRCPLCRQKIEEHEWCTLLFGRTSRLLDIRFSRLMTVSTSEYSNGNALGSTWVTRTQRSATF